MALAGCCLPRRSRRVAGPRHYGGDTRLADLHRPLVAARPDHGPLRRGRHALNAAPAEQQHLLDLQALDTRLDQLAHRRRQHPDIAAAAALRERRSALGDSLVAAQTEESDVTREQAKADTDVEQVRARATRDQQRLDSGSVGSAKELSSLQHEIASLARRQAELEDVELEVMERLEAIQQRAAAVQAEIASLDDDLTETEKRRDGALAELDDEAQNVRTERDALAAQIGDDLLALYTKLREQNGGVGVAVLRQRRCEGCRLELNTTEISRLRRAPDDEVLRCDECRRILVRTADSGL